MHTPSTISRLLHPMSYFSNPQTIISIWLCIYPFIHTFTTERTPDHSTIDSSGYEYIQRKAKKARPRQHPHLRLLRSVSTSSGGDCNKAVTFISIFRRASKVRLSVSTTSFCRSPQIFVLFSFIVQNLLNLVYIIHQIHFIAFHFISFTHLYLYIHIQNDIILFNRSFAKSFQFILMND